MTGATFYRIYRGTTSGGEVFFASSTATSYGMSGLSVGTTYYFKVVAYAGNGGTVASPDSNETHLTLIPAAPILAVPTQSGSNSALLNWNAVSGATLYRIYRGTTSGSEVFFASTSGTNFSVAGLTAGTTYYFKVIAYTGSSSTIASPPSNEVQFSVPMPLAAPVLATPQRSGNNAILNWGAVGNASFYRVYKGTSSGAEAFFASTSGTTYTVTGLTTGNTYFFRVIAYDSKNIASPISNEVKFQP